LLFPPESPSCFPAYTRFSLINSQQFADSLICRFADLLIR
jgi:hypothetical protein